MKEVPRRGLEPLCLAAPDPKSGASANFATSAPDREGMIMRASAALRNCRASAPQSSWHYTGDANPIAEITGKALPDGGAERMRHRRTGLPRQLPYKSVANCTVRQGERKLFLETKILGAFADVFRVIQDLPSQHALRIVCTP